MKKIVLREGLKGMNKDELVNSVSLLKLVAGNSPQRPLSIEEMRRRVRIIDALEGCEPHAESLLLEDDDAKALVSAVETFPWSAASKAVLTIVDDVLNAETISKLSVVPKGTPEEKKA
jgi:hypothetical protein